MLRTNNESLHRISTLVGFLLGVDPVEVHNHERRKHEAHTRNPESSCWTSSSVQLSRSLSPVCRAHGGSPTTPELVRSLSLYLSLAFFTLLRG